MTSEERARLREAAEKATVFWHAPPAMHDGAATSAFADAASPAAVLALLDEVERLRDVLSDAASILSAAGDLGIRHGSDAAGLCARTGKRARAALADPAP